MCGVLIPRFIYKELREEKKVTPKTIPRSAVLSINVVNFTHLCSDGTPEELTSILNKLYDMIEHRLENYESYQNDICCMISAFKKANECCKRSSTYIM